MADPNPLSTDQSAGEAGPPDANQRKERDFGDSAGYGGGGSALDRHEVGDTPTEEDKKPNPLDAVVKTRKA